MERTAIVTGGTGGLGRRGHARAARRRLARRRAVVRRARARARRARTSASTSSQADLTDPASVASVVDAAGDDAARARQPRRRLRQGERVHETPIETSSAQLALNLRPTYLCARPRSRRCSRRAAARSSASPRAPALQPFPGAARLHRPPRRRCSRSSTPSHAEYRDDGIRTNAILPSIIDTPGQPRVDARRRPRQWVTPRGDRARHRVPLLRMTRALTSGAPRPGLRTRMTDCRDHTPYDRRWWTLGAVCVATFMLLLDITIVNVALPDIAKDLQLELLATCSGSSTPTRWRSPRCC